MRKRVIEARKRQVVRFAAYPGVHSNALLTNKLLEQLAPLSKDSASLLQDVIKKQHLSARAYHSIRRIARTVADLEGSEMITTNHLAEAIHYRTLDRQTWEG